MSFARAGLARIVSSESRTTGASEELLVTLIVLGRSSRELVHRKKIPRWIQFAVYAAIYYSFLSSSFLPSFDSSDGVPSFFSLAAFSFSSFSFSLAFSFSCSSA